MPVRAATDASLLFDLPALVSALSGDIVGELARPPRLPRVARQNAYGRYDGRMLRKLWQVAMLLLVISPVQAWAADPLRFSGETKSSSGESMAVAVEVDVEASPVTGTLKVPGASFEIVEGVLNGDRFTAKIVGDAGQGRLELTAKGDDWLGTYELASDKGTITLRPTALSLTDALAPKPINENLTLAQKQADLDALVSGINTRHASPFHSVSKPVFDTAVADVRARLAGMDGPAMQAAFRRLTALIGDAHTAVAAFPKQPRLPLQLYWFDNGLRVVGASADFARLLGARVVALDGVPANEALRRFDVFRSRAEPEASWQALGPWLLTRPAMLREAGLLPREAAAPTWTFELPDGDVIRQQLAPRQLRDEDMQPLGGRRPTYQQRPNEEVWWAPLPASRTLYVNWRSYDGLASRWEALMREVDGARPERMVIDMRDNRGGDFNIGRQVVLSSIKARPWLNDPARLVVLVGRDTFSAAMTNAIDFATKTRATMTGEAVGERPNSWQEGRPFTLPNSGLRATVSTRFYRFVPGKGDVFAPAKLVPARWQDWAQGCDTVLKVAAGTCSIPSVTTERF